MDMIHNDDDNDKHACQHRSAGIFPDTSETEEKVKQMCVDLVPYLLSLLMSSYFHKVSDIMIQNGFFLSSFSLFIIIYW